MTGGGGEKKTLRLVAQYPDASNLSAGRPICRSTRSSLSRSGSLCEPRTGPPRGPIGIGLRDERLSASRP
jgi:hypothetical protein